MEPAKIKVLIVDDSRLVRETLEHILLKDPDIEIVGKAEDPYEAAAIIKKCVPDVMTLDIEMPKMDGLTFLRKVMSQRPIPTVIISSLSEKGSEATIRALRYGAVDYYTKSSINMKDDLEKSGELLVDKIKIAFSARINRIIPKSVKPKLHEDGLKFKNDKVILIGSSTGGTEALYKVLSGLPQNFPPVIIVQHMPAMFTKQFANRLDQDVEMEVVEAQDGERLQVGKVLIAPGDFHMVLKRDSSGYYVSINQDEKVNRHRPSVDVLMDSAINKSIYTKEMIGVILTGMGKDGAEGLLKLKNLGSKTLGQDEQSCVVFGMPKAAQELGAVDFVLDIEKIAPKLIELTRL